MPKESPVHEAADGYLTIEEARAVARVSRRTIYNWITAGKLVTQRTAGGALRILASSLWQATPSSE
jgi:excisionase family DNA binding protein